MIDINKIDVTIRIISGYEYYFEFQNLPSAGNIEDKIICDVLIDCNHLGKVGIMERCYYFPYTVNKKTAYLYFFGKNDNYYYIILSNGTIYLLLKIDCSYFTYAESLKYIIQHTQDFFDD